MHQPDLPLAPAFVPVHMLKAPPSTSIITPAPTAMAEPAPPVERRTALIEVVLANGRMLRVAEDIAPATLRRLAGALDGP